MNMDDDHMECRESVTENLFEWIKPICLIPSEKEPSHAVCNRPWDLDWILTDKGESEGMIEVVDGIQNDQNGPVIRGLVGPTLLVLLFVVAAIWKGVAREAVSYLELKWLSFTDKEKYHEFKRLGFSKKKDYDDYKRLRFTSKVQYDEFKASHFVNKDAYMASRTCQVCHDDMLNPKERIGCPGGHNTCSACSIQTLDAALRDRENNIYPQGIPCVMRPRSLGGCPEFLNDSFFKRLQDLGTPREPDDRVLRLHRYISEANVLSALSINSRMFCPHPGCGEIIWIDQNQHIEGDSGLRRCPSCSNFICLHCRAAYHTGESCAAAQARQNQEESETQAYIQATSKPCPNCGVRTSHYHGHACHHIRPGGGCTSCKVHWCYACGATQQENIRERGTRTRCRCERGYWGAFCRDSDLFDNVVADPYPRDRRCGCFICPECRPGDQCDSCDGTCIVCRGLVSPGPTSLPSPYSL